jgi:hypothetical protein
MNTVSDFDELIEPEHVVPTHLSTPDRVGWLTVRQLNLLLGPVLFGSPAGWVLGQPMGVEVSAALAALPMLAGGLLALPISPPIEHGLRKAVEHAWRGKGVDCRNASTYTGVRDVTADGVVRLTWKQECRAVWRLPSTNLRLAHSLQKRATVTRWASFLDGLTCPVQVVVRATPVAHGDHWVPPRDCARGQLLHKLLQYPLVKRPEATFHEKSEIKTGCPPAGSNRQPMD